jgi:hypothetical protein
MQPWCFLLVVTSVGVAFPGVGNGGGYWFGCFAAAKTLPLSYVLWYVFQMILIGSFFATRIQFEREC